MKTVLITGVGKGIGRALAEKFLSEGYFVIGTSTKGKIDLVNENLKIFQLDLSNPKSIEECAKKILDFNKPIDILINNAGVVWPEHDQGNWLGFQTEILRKTLEINLIGPIDFTERVQSLIKPGGHVVNVSSRQGSLSYVHEARNPSYNVSKAGVNMFTRMLSFLLEKRQIVVSSVHPGAVRTDMGAADANMEPKEAAGYIYDLGVSRPETGQFWFKDEKFPW